VVLNREAEGQFGQFGQFGQRASRRTHHTSERGNLGTLEKGRNEQKPLPLLHLCTGLRCRLLFPASLTCVLFTTHSLQHLVSSLLVPALSMSFAGRVPRLIRLIFCCHSFIVFSLSSILLSRNNQVDTPHWPL